MESVCEAHPHMNKNKTNDDVNVLQIVYRPVSTQAALMYTHHLPYVLDDSLPECQIVGLNLRFDSPGAKTWLKIRWKFSGQIYLHGKNMKSCNSIRGFMAVLREIHDSFNLQADGCYSTHSTNAKDNIVALGSPKMTECSQVKCEKKSTKYRLIHWVNCLMLFVKHKEIESFTLFLS